MGKIVFTLALCVWAAACAAAPPRHLLLAQRLDGPSEVGIASIEWQKVSGDSTDYWLRVGWTETQLRIGIKVRKEDLADRDYFNLCLDFDNQSAFSYHVDDYHFSVSQPDESGELTLSLSRAGGTPVEPTQVIRGSGAYTDDVCEIELSIDIATLSGTALAEGRDLGMMLELKQMSGPNLLPIHWGDVILGDEKGNVVPEILERVRRHQSRQAERFETHQADPEAPRRLSAEVKGDLERVRERIVRTQKSDVDRAELKAYVRSQQDDGSWEDIRYYDAGLPDAEGCWEHLNRLVDLAIGVRFAGLGEEAQAALYQGLNYWFDNDFVFTNWWRNEIGVPLQMGRIALLDDGLSASKLARIVKIMKRATRPMTGQNLVWINKIAVMRGVIEQNPALVQRAFERIEGTVDVTAGEGLQADFSFHQHGALLYSHGYGADFAKDAAQVYYWSQGGRFEMSRGTLELLENMLLEGNRWMSRGPFVDFGALGRNVTRPASSARYMAEVAATLLDADAERKEELRKLVRSASGEGGDDLAGNRYFHRSEFMAHRRPEFYASINVYSKRMAGTEYLNGEGLKSYYLPDGTTLFVRSGDEYQGLLPIWDWRKVPGATIPVSSEPIPIIGFRRGSSKGGSDFAGGVSDGWFGCVGYDYRKDGVTAKKAYFGFNWGLLCLGAEIQSATGERLQTAVNQTRLRGEVALGSARGEAERFRSGERRLEGDERWVAHDGFFYYFPEGESVSIAARTQLGSWRELSRRESDATMSGEVFSLTLSHGVAEQPDRYAYAVVAQDLIKSPEVFAGAPRFAVLENSGRIQAAVDREEGVLGSVFYEAGQLEVGSEFLITVDRRCALLLREGSNDEFVVTAASPARETGELRVTIRKVDSGEQRAVILELPGGLHAAGSSVSGRIEFD